ncbi:lasso RiPP family leader peptide-containing protein [Actinomadura sp. WMMB 499]|nr:lasso RiPP family leader peptide-containing protein [Actinomadura sp. WMMB 499]
MQNAYEPPTLIEIGDLRDVTLGNGTWGVDEKNQCWYFGCIQG